MPKVWYKIAFIVSLILFIFSLTYSLSQYLNARASASRIAKYHTAFEREKERGNKPAAAKEATPVEKMTNIFAPEAGMDVPSKLSTLTPVSPAVTETPEDFSLAGTVYSPTPSLRRAVIFAKKDREEIYVREGDTFLGGYRVKSIGRGYITIEKNGKISKIELPPPGAGEEKKTVIPRPTGRSRVSPTPRKSAIKVSKIDENTFAVDESSVDYLTENINKIITHVRIIPYFERGEAAGFRLAAIRPGSEFSQLGFSPGDIIKKVNGIPLTSPEKIYTIFQNLKDEKKIEVDILRRGEKKTLVYEIR
ncbi:MAG: hypothetical protein D6713_07420 [Deltaproteobacteria bacterium]|nr:MAG: hypothetical protein D6713_07420 [Deltaproteobacteria bacterium]